MTDDELAAIREHAMTADRAAIWAAAAYVPDHLLEAVSSTVASALDVPTLLAEVERLRAVTDKSREVADHWRRGLLDETAGGAHALCMVLAALDGETDPAELGMKEMTAEPASTRRPAPNWMGDPWRG